MTDTLAPRPLGPDPVTSYLLRLAPSSRVVQGRAIAAVSAFLGHPDPRTCPWGQLTPEVSDRIRDHLVGRRLAPATINRHLAALRGVLKAAVRTGAMDESARARAVDVQPAKGSGAGDLPGRVIEPAEFQRLLDAAAQGATLAITVRDRALLWLLAGAGVRRAELATLQAGAMAAAGPVGAQVRTITVTGKGSKTRVVPIPAVAHAALEAYEVARGPCDPALPYLWAVGRSGRFRSDPIRGDQVYAIVDGLAARAQIDPPPTPHDFRRTFATRLIDAGTEIARISELMGHASIGTTMRYIRSSTAWREGRQAAVDNAMAGLSPGEK